MNSRIKHALIPGALYGEDMILEDASLSRESDNFIWSNNKERTLLEQVSHVTQITTPDIHVLAELIRNFKNKNITNEDLIYTVNSVLDAIRSLMTGESYRLNVYPLENREQLRIGNSRIKQLHNESIRMFEYGVRYFHHNEKGINRIIQSFGRDDFWFSRRRLLPEDLAFNFNYTPAGMMVDVNRPFTHDFKFNRDTEAYVVQI